MSPRRTLKSSIVCLPSPSGPAPTSATRSRNARAEACAPQGNWRRLTRAPRTRPNRDDGETPPSPGRSRTCRGGFSAQSSGSAGSRRPARALELAQVAVADRADAPRLDRLEPVGGAEVFGVRRALLPGPAGRLHLGGQLAAVDENLAHLARR